KAENKRKQIDKESKLSYIVIQLILLYILQGLPIGLLESIRIILQQRDTSLGDQGILSIALWPFSLKLLWAPFVDGLKLPFMGRRKSWLVPSQYGIGFSLLYMASSIDSIMGTSKEKFNGNIYTIAILFFMFIFFAATQDIALDGWTLTMLPKKFVGWASICNLIGQIIGAYITSNILLLLISKDFYSYYHSIIYSTNYTGDDGFLTLKQCIYILSLIFLIATTTVLLFKKEKDVEEKYCIVSVYKQCFKLLKHKPILSLIKAYFVLKIPFMATESIAVLRLIHAGIKPEIYATITAPLIFVDIISSLMLAKHVTKFSNKPLMIMMKFTIIRSLFAIILAISVHYICEYLLNLPPSQSIPNLIYFYIFILSIVITILSKITNLSHMSFHAQISDPLIGGSFMTLLNVATNFGSMWVVTVSLWVNDWLTVTECTKICVKEGDCETKCVITNDSYLLVAVLSFIVGSLIIMFLYKKMFKLLALSTRFRFIVMLCKLWMFDEADLQIERSRNSSYDSNYLKIIIFFSKFVQSIGDYLKMRQEVLYTAIVYLKRFYIRNNFYTVDPLLMAPTALYLASKVEEFARLKTDTFLLSCKSVYNMEYKNISNFFVYSSDDLYHAECCLIQKMDFCLIIYSPYRNLHLYSQSITSDNSMLQLAWNLTNDTLRTDIPLLYPPHLIALASPYSLQTAFRSAENASTIHYACVIKDIDVTDWFANLTIDINKIIDITRLIKTCHEFCKTYEESEEIPHLIKTFSSLNGIKYVRRTKERHSKYTHINSTVKFSSSIMIWGAIREDGQRITVRCANRVNYVEYISILNRYIDELQYTQYIFQHDGALCVRSRMTNNFIKNRYLNTLDSWPPQ
ncbi:Acetyl-CoA transporter 1, partial [Intoshia linei]